MQKRETLLLVLLLLGTADGRAAIFQVDSLGDDLAADGLCTLREAVAAAEGGSNDCGSGATPGADEIRFDAGLTGRIDLLGGPLVVTDSLTVTGPGSDVLSVDAGRNSRIFEIDQAADAAFAISNLALANGSSTGHGGVLLVDGETSELLLEDVVVRSGFALGSGAGLAIVEPAEIEIRILGSTFEDNESDGGAGALDLIPATGGTAATVTIEDTRFQDNDSGDSSAVMIACDRDPCSVAIRRSGFVGSIGGHLDVSQQAMPAANVFDLSETGFYPAVRVDSTGGIRFTGNSGAVRLLNNSLGTTEADSGTAPPVLWLDTGSPTALAVIAFNSFESAFGDHIEITRGIARLKGNGLDFASCTAGTDGGFESLGDNVIGDGISLEGECGLGTASGDMLVEGPLFAVFGPFDDEGSSPPYARPRVGGSVIDAVTDCSVPDIGPLTAFALDRDQRGSVRPAESIDANRCDAGAVETGGHLVVQLTGSGAGRLRADPPLIFDQFDIPSIFYDAAIDPNSTRTYYRWPGDVTTLIGEGNNFDTFDGFSGDCSGTDPCTLTQGPAMLGASFTSVDDLFSLTVELSGTAMNGASGRVTSSPAGIDCGPTGGSGCAAFFAPGTEVTLTVSTDAGGLFLGWEATDCDGRGLCRLTMDGAREATARFGSDLIIRTSFEADE